MYGEQGKRIYPSNVPCIPHQTCRIQEKVAQTMIKVSRDSIY